MAAGVDPDHTDAPVVMGHDEVLDFRSGHLLASVFPLLYDVLGRAAEDCDCVMAVGDSAGRLLWVCGRPAQLRAADGIQFVEGADWQERTTGTNAPGTAIALGTAVQIGSREHFSTAYKDWSCSAAPIHHPESQEVIGVVDVTGRGVLDTPQTLAMVRSAARMAEAELGRLITIQRAGRDRVPLAIDPDTLRLCGLGRPDLQLEWRGRVIRLSRRNSDALAVLADTPEGMSAEQLAIEIYDDDVRPSTLRAQMTRLRALLGDGLLESRPYRLAASVSTDWLDVVAALQAGRIAAALQIYRGPLLPISDAPGVTERRARIERELVRALLASKDTDLLAAATRARWAASNLQLWERQAELLPRDSPLFAASLNEIRLLREEYGVPARRQPNRLHRL